jgi:uncharacterized protein YndB with AHSA1/START domain
MRRWILSAIASLAAIVVLVAIVGLMLPQGHQASRTISLSAEPQAVFDVIADFLKYPQWRSDVKSVVMDGEGGKGTVIHEDGPDGLIPYRVEIYQPPTRLVLQISDSSLPFGGTWSYKLQQAPGGTELTLTEDGIIRNPIFRVMQKLFFSPYATMDTFLADLEKRLKRGQ